MGDAPQPPPSARTDAVERHFADIQAHYARGVGGTVRDDPDVRLSGSGLPARVVNAVNGARFTAATADDRIADAQAFFAAIGPGGVPFRWFVGPSSGPANLTERLEAAGIGKISDSPGMYLDIDRMRDELPDIPGFEVREVASAADLEEWLSVSRTSAGFDDHVFDSWARAHRALGWGPAAPLHNFVGRLKGRPVSVAAVLLADDIAGIWNVGTLADVRGRGMGRETTLAALRLGRDHGYRRSVLGSSPLGLPVYTRIGFEEVCRIRHYGPAIP